MKKILGVKLYSMSEAAEMLGITRVTLSRLANRGDIEFRQIGRAKYVSESELVRFVNGE